MRHRHGGPPLGPRSALAALRRRSRAER
jgi:hypothetical protein